MLSETSYTNLALFSSLATSGFNILLKIHLLEIDLQPLGRYTNSQVLLLIIDSSSLLMASFKKKSSPIPLLGTPSGEVTWELDRGKTLSTEEEHEVVRS